MNNFKLAELLEKIIDNRGKTPPLVETGFELIESSSLVGDRKYPYYNSISKYVTSHIFNTWFRSGHPQKNDILIATVGANIGSVAIMGENRGCIAQNLVALRVKINLIDPHYLFYFLFWDRTNKLLKNLDIGAAQPSIKVPHLLEIEIPLPKIGIQIKIGTILSAYDDLIECNTRRIRILEEMAQAIFREWFVHFRFPGHEGMRMVESELGLVPEEWEVRKLGDIAEEVRRNVEPNNLDSNIPYFGLEHIPRKSIALSDWGFAKNVQSTKHKFFKGEILFGKIRPYFHKVGVAPVDGVCSSDAIVIRPKKSEYFGLVLFCVSSEDFVNHATQTSQGTKMPRANWNVLVNYPVVIPPKLLLDEFNNIASDMVDLIITKIFQNTNLRCTRDLLLPKLISGWIDVSELDIRIPEAEA